MSWIDKRDSNYSYKIKTLTKSFADIAEGSKMLVATPLIIDSYKKSTIWNSHKFVIIVMTWHLISRERLVQFQQQFFKNCC